MGYTALYLTGITCSGDDIASYRNQKVSKKDLYYFGEFVTLKCIDGYKVIGINSQFCKEDGSWSNANPDCVGEKQLFYWSVLSNNALQPDTSWLSSVLPCPMFGPVQKLSFAK